MESHLVVWTYQEINGPLPNHESLARDVALGYSAVFGGEAFKTMLQAVTTILQSGSRNGYRVYAAVDSQGRAGALAVVSDTEDAREFSILHAIPGSAGLQAGETLIHGLTSETRSGTPLRPIVADTLLTGDVPWDNILIRAGFTMTRRFRMRAPLSTIPELPSDMDIHTPSAADDLKPVAKCMVESYADSPDRVLHPEMRDVDVAERYLRRLLLNGATLITLHDAKADPVSGGLIEMTFPGNAFLLYLFTRPDQRRQGFADRVLVRLKRVAAVRYVASRMWLCVSAGNPALEFYHHSLFEFAGEQPAFYWTP